MKKITKNIAALIALGIGSTTIGTAQITHQKIGDNPTTINSSAVLEVESTDKGALLPRIALTDLKDATTIANAANALTVFNTATAGTAPNDVTPGYYYWKKDEIIPANSTWVRLTDGATPTPYWSLVGNAGTDPANNFLGTTDNQDLIFKVNNSIRLIGPKSSNMYLLSGAPSMLNSYLSNPLTGKYFGGFTTFNGEHSIYNFSETGQSYGWNSGAASGTPAAPGIPDTGALMSTVNGMLYDGTNFIKVARMRMHADGTPTATSLPTKITFWTTPANSKADVERLVIKNNGNVGIGLTYPGNPSNMLHVRNASGNPVRFEGLQTGVATDDVVVADNTGVLKTVAPSSLAVEPWNVRGTATTKATDNAQNIYQKGNVAIGTQNGLGTFHIDTAKDNPATGTPTATNVLDDFITSDRGRFGFGYYPSDVFNASGQFDDKVTFQANDDLDLNYSLATTDNGQAIVHRNIISSGTIETRTARPTGTSIAAFEGHTSVQNRGYGLSSLGVTQQRAGMVLRTGKYNDLGGEIWFGVSGASAGDGGKTLVNAAGVKYRAVMDQKGNWAFGSDPNFDNFWRSPSERLDLILGGMRIGALGYGPLAAWRVAEIAERPNYISTDANDRLVVADANGVLKVKEVATILPTEPWRVQTTTNNATANADHIYQTGRVGVGDFSMAFPVGYTPKKLEVKGDFKSETIVGGNLVGMEVNSPLVTQGAGTYWINPTTREAHSMSVGQFGASATVIDDYAAAVPGKVSNFILDLNAVNVYSKHNGEAKQGTLEVNGANGYFALYANEHNKFGAMVKSAGEDGLLLYHANSEAGDNVSLKNRTEVVVKKADGVTFHHHDASGTLSGSYTFPKTNGTNGQVMTRSTGNSVVWADAIPKFFYAPSMVMPTSTTGGLPAHVSYAGGVFTVDLHAVYSNQYGMTGNVAGPTRTALKSPSATTLPVVPAVNLEYFVTYFDNTVFNPDTIQLTNAGILTYEILPGAVVTEKTYMNITFKVK
ncbi:hypothetical protein ACI6PS_04375 [Flavobacterium sp. PLA-1-15]|uniref:hypothetical protein n=1 Tax=Flavobacterium sp. PLA-1-15 TaxID=3380533 RepID=UPI003B7FBA58